MGGAKAKLDRPAWIARSDTMVETVVLIPAFLALAMLAVWPASKVMLRIYLPCLLLIPPNLIFYEAGFSINTTSLLTAVLTIAGLYRFGRTLRFSVLDACIMINVLSVFYADARHGQTNIGIYATLDILCATVFPYWIGRTLIEQPGVRTKAAKIIVICLAIIGIFSIWEYRMISNPFQNTVGFLERRIPDWGRQMRWGFARIAGPYGSAIFAGMVFTVALMLQIWLTSAKKWLVQEPSLSTELQPHQAFPRANPLARRSGKRKMEFLTFALLLGFAMTQSRGPWMGCGLGLIIICAGLAKNRKRATVFAAMIMVVALVLSGLVLDKYTAGQINEAQNLDQQNAVYRRQLIDIYVPLIKIGGMWGWGSPHALNDGFGWDARAPSIDNYFLLLGMRQGYFGAALFIVMLLLCGGRLISLCVKLRHRDDMIFAYVMLAIVAATAFTLTTVALENPMIQILFLCFGWSESIRPTRQAVAVTVSQKYAFERVLV